MSNEVEDVSSVSAPPAAAPAVRVNAVASEEVDEPNNVVVAADGGEGAEDGELSEEEDTDYVEDTGETGLRTGDNAEDGEETEVKPHIPMLLEGDYFPELPKDVLDELNALDAEEDTEVVGAQGAFLQSETTARPAGDRDSLVPSDRQGASAVVLPSSTTTMPSTTVSSAESVCEVRLSAGASVGSAPNVVVPDRRSPAPRKRLRWSDDCRGKRVGHVATVFTIPGHWFGTDTNAAATGGPSFPRRGGSVASGVGGSTSRSYAAQHPSTGPKWTTVLNEDGKPFALAKQLRVADAYHRWRSTDALEWSRRLYESNGGAGGGTSADGSTENVGTNAGGDANRPKTLLSTIPATGSVVVPPYPMDRMLLPQLSGKEEGTQEGEARSSGGDRPTTLYAALFPSRGRLVLFPAETLRTTLVYVTGGLSQVPIPDDDGLVRAPLWHSDAHRTVLLAESAASDEAVTQAMQATKSRRRTLFALDDNGALSQSSTHDAPIRIVL